jgi:hypothetical protein
MGARETKRILLNQNLVIKIENVILEIDGLASLCNSPRPVRWQGARPFGDNPPRIVACFEATIGQDRFRSNVRGNTQTQKQNRHRRQPKPFG